MTPIPAKVSPGRFARESAGLAAGHDNHHPPRPSHPSTREKARRRKQQGLPRDHRESNQRPFRPKTASACAVGEAPPP